MAPISFTRAQLVRQATLTDTDLVEVAACRRDHNRLGFAYQIGFVRLFHRFPAQHPFEVCPELLNFVALQLQLDASLGETYTIRQHTVSDHQACIRQYLDLTPFGPEQTTALEKFVFAEAMRLEHAAALLSRAREFLTERHVLFPADSALLRLVGEQRKRAREHIVTKLAQDLPAAVTKALDNLLVVNEEESISALQRIKSNPAKPSANAMLALTDKLAAIEATGVLLLDLSWLNSNYQRSLFHYVRACSADRLRDLVRPRCLAALVCFLRQSYRDAVDQAVDMFDKLLTRTCTQAENDLDDQMRTQRQTIRVALDRLRSFGVIILDDSIESSDLRTKLFEVVPREELTQQVQGLAEWVTGKTSDVFHGVIGRQNYLRQFTPVLLQALEFFPDSQDTNVPCLKALELLNNLNSNQKRKLPDDAPTDFISKRLLPFVADVDYGEKGDHFHGEMAPCRGLSAKSLSLLSGLCFLRTDRSRQGRVVVGRGQANP